MGVPSEKVEVQLNEAWDSIDYAAMHEEDDDRKAAMMDILERIEGLMKRRGTG